MVRHNNAIPNGHFHKKWQNRVKTWFDQPMKKMRRRKIRTLKMLKSTPRPVKILRPIVHCPSSRYNMKERIGRGFTLHELKQAGINRNIAKTIGICVDFRRRNRSYESVAKNAARLKSYKMKLIFLDRKPKDKNQAEYEKSLLANIVTDSGANLNKPPVTLPKLKARKINKDDLEFQAFTVLRKARTDEKYWGLRQKKKLVKNDPFETSTKLTK